MAIQLSIIEKRVLTLKLLFGLHCSSVFGVSCLDGYVAKELYVAVRTVGMNSLSTNDKAGMNL